MSQSQSTGFTQLDLQPDFPKLEEEVLAYWKENKTFEKSIESRPADKPWTFLDGPPFITGLPHYGTLLSSIPKDVFPRFKTMQGYRVRRVWGWDCHGLPAENKVEATLGVKKKKDIEEKVGVEKFIAECKRYVENVSEEWEWYVDHIARWVDFRNAYRTMDTPYMESVMWVFSQMYRKGYVYKGLRVSLYCPHCSTPISNFEVAMDPENYKMVSETATTYKYRLTGEENTYILAWSTTPWNKIATPALAVNPTLGYVKVRQGQEFYILAESTLGMLVDEPYEVIERFRGQDLVGKSFEPHYSFYTIDKGKRAFVIVPGDFVTADEGTGVVTIAAYGEEDLAVMQKENIQIVLHIDDEGMLKPDVPKWGGMYYLEVNPLVNEDLRSRNLVYRDDPIQHTVPTCWRCHTRLVFAPQDAWYVDIQRLKPDLAKTNESVNWYPEHFKYGRFLKSMQNAPDWCISRSRYWGSPVPVWECSCGERIVPESIRELETLSGSPVPDLHKPGVDDITIPCPKCGDTARRVPEVLDSWIEAGSAPYAERHYPFTEGLKLEDFFPPDFIVEYTGQIRAWFYVLHAISTALFGSHAFKNVVVTGVILGTDGRKMSKNYGNYPDPKEMIQKYGGDALRLYLLGSPIMHGEDIRISELEYRNQVRGVLLLLWNVYNFFVMYANLDGWSPDTGANPDNPVLKPHHILDRWVMSRLNTVIRDVTALGYDRFDTPYMVDILSTFLQDVSQWYVRRSRDRIGPKSSDPEDSTAAYRTLFTVLTTYLQLIAPVTPFISEKLYRNLTGAESVHLTSWPEVNTGMVDPDLESEMDAVRMLSSVIHAGRKTHNLKVRIPLLALTYTGPRELSPPSLALVAEETNVKTITFTGVSEDYTVSGSYGKENQDETGGKVRELVRQVQIMRKERGCTIHERIRLTLPAEYRNLDEEHLSEIRRLTIARELSWGDQLDISTG